MIEKCLPYLSHFKFCLYALPDSSWASIENFVKENSFNESRFGLFGYYSKHSVCIPNMLAGLNDAGVGFSAFITGFNMVAFIYVVVSYIFIYKGAVGTVDRAGSIMTNHSSECSYVSILHFSLEHIAVGEECNVSSVYLAWF